MSEAYEKKNIFRSSSYQWVDIFVNLLADEKTVDSTPIGSLLAADKNQLLFFLSMHKIQLSKQIRLTN